jgi:hypothetical protein
VSIFGITCATYHLYASAQSLVLTRGIHAPRPCGSAHGRSNSAILWKNDTFGLVIYVLMDLFRGVTWGPPPTRPHTPSRHWSSRACGVEKEVEGVTHFQLSVTRAESEMALLFSCPHIVVSTMLLRVEVSAIIGNYLRLHIFSLSR